MKQDCGCEVTEDLVFKPCKPHWEQMSGEYDKMVRNTLTGNIHYEPSLGIKVVDT